MVKKRFNNVYGENLILSKDSRGTVCETKGFVNKLAWMFSY